MQRHPIPTAFAFIVVMWLSSHSTFATGYAVWPQRFAAFSSLLAIESSSATASAVPFDAPCPDLNPNDGWSTHTCLRAVNSTNIQVGSIGAFYFETYVETGAFFFYNDNYTVTTFDTAKAKVSLNPNGPFTNSFNHRVPTEHLSDLYAQEVRAARLDTDYALITGGRYFLKAVLDDSTTKSVVESKPIEVLISEPVGNDGLAWALLQKNPESAYFLQVGNLPRDPVKTNRLIEALNEIVERYPDCIYAERINANLEKVRGRE